jgi:hypothetical protein
VRRLSCPGYDRTVDAFFHDETAKVQAKAKVSQARSGRVQQQHHDRERQSTALVLANTHTSPTIQLLVPLIDQGLSFFMTHYAVGLDQPSIASESYSRHLSTSGFHPLISTTMTALGIAGVANIYQDPALKREATRWYLDAIKLANKAISSPKDVRNDTTLVAVNLLTMFEATFNEKSFSGWSNHVDGSSLLVKMRGRDQISTSTGRRMYLHTVGLLTINCMGKGIFMPDFVNEINEEIKDHLDHSDPRTAFFFLHLKTTDLRAEILQQKTVDLAIIIDKALELDAIAQSIFAEVGEEWKFATVPCFEKIPGVFGHFYHVYPTHATAQTWNWVRYNRIYFHDIIRNCILAGFATSPPALGNFKYTIQLGDSTRTLQQLQGDIIASMPQLLHDTPMFPPTNAKFAFGSKSSSSDPNAMGASSFTPAIPVSDHDPLTPPASRGNTPLPHDYIGERKRFFQNFRDETIDLPKPSLDCAAAVDRLPVVRVSGGYSTVWSLYVAGSMPTASPESQDFVLHCFSRIEHEFGIMQASVFGNALRLKRSMDNSGETPLSLCPRYLPPTPAVNVPYGESESVVSFVGLWVLRSVVQCMFLILTCVGDRNLMTRSTPEVQQDFL